MFKYVGNELVITYFNSVDQNFSLKLAETVTKSVNIRLKGLVSANHFLSAEAVLSEEDNTLENVINGDITWTINLGVIPAMKSMTFKKKYDVKALETFAQALKQ